ncbi:MAG: 3-oxoacyl-[acyl-carrier-protein] synthase III C-terminal domain-containing protein [Thermoleophilia bacterium]
MGKPFVINRHGRLVFPSNFLADLDFSAIETEEQLSAVVRRDFEAKAPTGDDIMARASSGGYRSRFQLLRDLALNLFWANRYAMTMYEKRPTRWRDVPRNRGDIYLPILSPWKDGDAKVAAVAACYPTLPAAFDEEAEDRIHAVLFDVYRNKLHHASELSAIKLTVQEVLAADDLARTYCLSSYDPDYPVYGYDEILDCAEEHPELEALMRMAMVMHNQYPWDRGAMRLKPLRQIDPDEFVVVFHPRNREVSEFIRRERAAPSRARPRSGAPDQATPPAETVPPIIVADRFAVKPRIESLAVQKGELICRNEDLIRNTAFSWSHMTAEDISEKTGIESRIYTELDLDELSLIAATRALEGSGRRPEEIAAVIFCSCTSTHLLPSVATWISGQLGIFQTHVSFDLVAACAGFPYGIGEALRLLQDVRRPVLLVCAEKFSDKIGSVRPSRMIFGDGAAAMVIAPAGEGDAGDVEVVQTYASGPASQVNSIIWPNPEFDNDVTVWGPEVKALVERYLVQMMGELRELPHPDDPELALVDAIDLVVPHQANRTMVVELAGQAGIAEDSLYFNIDKVGNVSAASIPIAIWDAVEQGVIDRRMRIFAPGFGAGAVAGYAVLWIDPATIVPDGTHAVSGNGAEAEADGNRAHSTTLEDVREAFN